MNIFKPNLNGFEITKKLFRIESNNKKFRSFKSKENIHKKEGGPYRGFGYSSFISDPINLAKRAGG